MDNIHHIISQVRLRRNSANKISANVNRGHNSRMEKVVKSKIKFGLSLMVHDLVYKFQMICLVIEWWKPTARFTERGLQVLT